MKEMQSKTTRYCTAIHLLECLESGTLTRENVGEGVEPQELLSKTGSFLQY